MTDDSALKYSPFSSNVDPSFWHKLSQIKLDIDKLDEKVHPIWGSYSNFNTIGSPSLQVDCTSYNSKFEELRHQLPAFGCQLNLNTLESYKGCDKTTILEKQGASFWEDIANGSVLKKPALLSRFFLLTFGDLKKYSFYYWFAFLAPSTPSVQIVKPPALISTVFSAAQVESLQSEWSNIGDVYQRNYFLVKIQEDQAKILPLADIVSIFNVQSEELWDGFYLAFADPCSSGEAPGWPLRNLLCAVAHYCPHVIGRKINVLSFRLGSKPHGQINAEKSLIMSVELLPHNESELKWVGWERNNRGKFGPRFVDVSGDMDPKKRAESAVHLNLKLMKWRLLPEMDLDIVQNTRCLLMGAGTLGCTVARLLMGWGVQHITFVDNGTVSFSNPVRQSLFTFEDCLGGGKPKAQAAADALKLIFPGVNTSGVTMNIPMPGHPVGESMLKETRDAVSTLEKLVEDHDVVFMLTDSRESRWLPTLLAGAKKKLAMNAALGFDTYLVMRHGVFCHDDSAPDFSARSIPGRHLGCYFCNDVTAPGNSMADRTLDQQCTVTRPGVSAVAGALVVELMVSILQHPLKGDAPAVLHKTSGKDDEDEEGGGGGGCLLGTVPHSIRGFLASWEQLTPATHRFLNCIACSEKVLSEYASRGFDFIHDVLNSAVYLEDLTGLTSLHKETESADVWEYSDSEEEEERESNSE